MMNSVKGVARMTGRCMLPARTMLSVLVLALLVAGCSAGGSAAVTPGRPHPQGPATLALGPRYLDSLGPAAVISAREAWVAGSVDTGNGTATVMEHWDGARWSLLRSLAFAGWNIDGMAAGSARDVWAVGYTHSSAPEQPAATYHKILIGHFDGTAWRRVRVPPLPGDNVLGAAAVVSTRDAWAVGSWGAGRRRGGPLILHWDGSAWSRVDAPGPVGSGLEAVAGLSARDAWAVGNSNGRTLIEHWDGTAWRQVPSPNPSRVSDDLRAVAAVSPRDVWAAVVVGNRVGRGRTLITHWDGTAWKVVPSPRRPGGQLLTIAAAVISGRPGGTAIPPHASSCTGTAPPGHLRGRQSPEEAAPSALSQPSRATAPGPSAPGPFPRAISSTA